MDIIKIPIDARFNDQTILDFLRYFNVSKPKIHLLQQHHLLLVNDQFKPFQSLLVSGDIITIDVSEFESIDFIPEFVPIDILYEDEDILIVNKPAGIIIHPADKSESKTLVNRIAGYYQQNQINRQIRYLHRLDTETTGCILIAKHFLIHSYLANHWDHDVVKRQYLAFVMGHPFKETDTITFPIGKDRHNNNRYRVKYEGEPAITTYQVIDQYPAYSLLRVELKTGKTHQIRVHMSHLGHPLLGDTLYGGLKDIISRVALHSESIEFINPVSGKSIKVAAPLPEDLLRLL